MLSARDPRYGRVEVEAWHGVHPRLHGRGRWAGGLPPIVRKNTAFDYFDPNGFEYSALRDLDDVRALCAVYQEGITGAITGHDASRKLDAGILQALWLLPDEIRAMQERHRSPLVLRCIEDYLAGKRYPLDLLVHYE